MAAVMDMSAALGRTVADSFAEDSPAEDSPVVDNPLVAAAAVVVGKFVADRCSSAKIVW